MASRISIYSHAGVYVTEVDADFDRTWKINEHAEASFTLALTDPKAIINNLEYGNLVYVEHDKLPTWIGSIETPREWGYGTVTVHCLSAEFILVGRLCGITEQFVGTPGNIFRQLINTAEGYAPGILRTGTVYDGGTSVTIVKPYEPIYDTILQMTKDYANDWDVTPALDTSGHLHLECNWYKQKGSVRIDRLIEDKNIRLVNNLYVEQGDICNFAIVYGDGIAWTTKVKSSAQDIAYIAKNGLRMGTFSVPGLTTAQAQETANNKLAEVKIPRKTFNLTVLDDMITPANSIFFNIRIGDILPLDLFSAGFTGGTLGLTTNIRVLGMRYKDTDNQLTLVCDDVTI